MSFALALVAAAALPFADLDAIDRDVMGFTGAPIGAVGGAIVPVDRRLRLQPCRSPLSLGWRTPSRESVIVQCPDPGGWRLFVPVRSGGGSATPGMAEPSSAPVIGRGDAVAIAVSGSGFTVSQPGEAMEAGAIGAWIKVRPVGGNTRTSSEPMRAQVVRPGLVTLPLP